MSGKVFLVGAGPGDPELLTVRAWKVLQFADAVLHDDLISPEILALIPATAEVRNVGKRCGRKSTPQEEINALLVTFASFGLKVVRLKGGDPLIFGRAGEEIAALRKARVDFEIVPGVTSALASAAAARVSLTHRDGASAVLLLTSHHATSARTVDWKAYVASGATLAIYMPGSDYQQTSQRLIAAGLKAHTACAIVSRASSSQQQVHRTTVQELPDAPLLPAPTLLLVGDVLDSSEEVQRNVHAATNMLQAGLAIPVPNVPTSNQPFLGD
jgi:uroporphyrin-III C-methyltransferase